VVAASWIIVKIQKLTAIETKFGDVHFTEFGMRNNRPTGDKSQRKKKVGEQGVLRTCIEETKAIGRSER
jgi:hypothetical protein